MPTILMERNQPGPVEGVAIKAGRGRELLTPMGRFERSWSFECSRHYQSGLCLGVHTITLGLFTASFFPAIDRWDKTVRSPMHFKRALGNAKYACKCVNIFRISLLSIFIAQTAFTSLAAAPHAGTIQGCLNYEPNEVALEGTISRRSFMNASDKRKLSGSCGSRTRCA